MKFHFKLILKNNKINIIEITITNELNKIKIIIMEIKNIYIYI